MGRADASGDQNEPLFARDERLVKLDGERPLAAGEREPRT